jgi:hypothetical protein
MNIYGRTSSAFNTIATKITQANQEITETFDRKIAHLQTEKESLLKLTNILCHESNIHEIKKSLTSAYEDSVDEKLSRIKLIQLESKPEKLEDFTVRMIHGFTYQGSVNEKKQPHGTGIAIYRNNWKYSGEFANGSREGVGTMQHYDKNITQQSLFIQEEYKGYFKNNDFVNGSFQYPNETLYIGEFNKFNKHGVGIEIDLKKNLYVGIGKITIHTVMV